MSDLSSNPAEFVHERLLAQAAWVRRLAGRLLVDDAAADDVAQQTLLTAMHGRPREEQVPAKLRAWLAAIARNVVRRTLRTDARRDARERLAATNEALPSSVDLVARAALQRAVVDAVLSLAEPYRTTVLLRFFEEVPTGEIARRRGEPIETVRTRLKRGLAQLRERLEGELDVETSGGLRKRGLAALVVLVGPVGAGIGVATGAAATSSVAATTAAAKAATAGVLAMATKAKLAAATVIFAVGAWATWEMRGGEGRAQDGTNVVAANLAPPVELAKGDSIRAQRVADAAGSDGSSTAAAAVASAPPKEEPQWSPLIAKLRAELTQKNLIDFMNPMNSPDVTDDLGVEIRSALQGLQTQTLDLEALLAYVESRDESSWVVRDSLESTMKSGEQETRWTQAYENSSGGGSVNFVGIGAESSGAGSISIQSTLGAWAREFDSVLGEARTISPLITLNLHRQVNGGFGGLLILNLQAMSKKQEPRANERFEELRAAGRLPPLVRFQSDGERGELTYYLNDANEMRDTDRLSSRPLTDREIDAIRRLYDRYQELAKAHVAAASAPPAAAK